MTRKENIKENDRKHYLTHKIHLGLCLRCQIIDLGKSINTSGYGVDQIQYYTSFLNKMYDEFKLVDTMSFNDVPTAKVPIPQIRPSEDFNTSDSMTQLLVRPIKKTNEDMVKSSVWSSELNNFDFRSSVFNLQASEKASCPICSIFRVTDGFNHCSSFCSSEAKMRTSRLVEVVEALEEEQESPLTWIKQDLNMVKLKITSLRRYERRFSELDFLDRMEELRGESIRLQTLLEGVN